jgi:hypothetical protein
MEGKVMNYYEGADFLGNWELRNRCQTNPIYQVNLNIEKTGETYKCIWKINKANTQHEYLGIGIVIDNQLFVSRFSNKVHGGGVGLYRPIGDLRSNSALWASTQNFNTLGSGIALREDTSENFEDNYKVRYFIKGNESPTFDLKILKSQQNEIYLLNWSVDDEVKLHGVGMISKGQMPLAYGGTNFDYEVVILNIEHENGRTTLKEKCGSLSNGLTVYHSCFFAVYFRYSLILIANLFAKWPSIHWYD